jgi:hypothetical protein
LLSFCLASFFTMAACACVSAQTVPTTPDRRWSSPYEQQIQNQSRSLPAPKFTVDASKAYSLPELVDLAEQHNPETRFGWERAKAQAAARGIARSEWYPVLGAVAAGDVGRQALLIDTNFLRQTVSTSDLAVELNYTILDFGRSARIQSAAAQLLAADFGFNDAHRRIIYQVEEAYYRVLSTASQAQAAEANLANAQAVQQAAQDRLDQGLATRPDLLEAQSATAQAQFDLQSAIGAQEIARGDLAAALGTSASVAIKVEPVTSLTTPDSVEDSVEQLITRALQQRPDLLQQVADLRAREAAVKHSEIRILSHAESPSPRRPAVSLRLTRAATCHWAAAQHERYQRVHRQPVMFEQLMDSGLRPRWGNHEVRTFDQVIPLIVGDSDVNAVAKVLVIRIQPVGRGLVVKGVLESIGNLPRNVGLLPQNARVVVRFVSGRVCRGVLQL